MANTKAGKRVTVLFYLLTAYILLQFFWWAYLLIKLNLELYQPSDPSLGNLKVLMVIGEGTVFFVFLLAGIFITQRTIKKEIKLVRQQRNFLLSITHELKTPLAAIKLCMDTLSKRDNLDHSQRSLLEHNVRDNTERLSLLIDNVLLATRIENGKETLNKADVNLSEVTHKILDRIDQTTASHSSIIRQIDSQIKGMTDIHNYESIVVNLVENAHKYGGESDILVHLSKLNNTAILEVSDSGAGISPELKDRVFEKFYRAENEETRTKKGTGLGLFIVKELVTLSEGKISIKDNTPTGSRFIVELPLVG